MIYDTADDIMGRIYKKFAPGAAADDDKGASLSACKKKLLTNEFHCCNKQEKYSSSEHVFFKDKISLILSIATIFGNLYALHY